MNADDLNLARERLAALKKASFPAGTNYKRFVMDTPLEAELSERQVAYIAILAWKFRRQLPNKIIPHGTPPNLPPKRVKSAAPPPPPDESKPDLFTKG